MSAASMPSRRTIRKGASMVKYPEERRDYEALALSMAAHQARSLSRC
jgi:hypothetical protein